MRRRVLSWPTFRGRRPRCAACGDLATVVDFATERLDAEPLTRVFAYRGVFRCLLCSTPGAHVSLGHFAGDLPDVDAEEREALIVPTPSCCACGDRWQPCGCECHS